MAQVTYGSITLVDLTDVGQLSVYPTSNMPLSIMYDPDQSTEQNKYTPNWSVNNLTLSPTVFYNTTQLTLPTTGLRIEWTRREGIAAATSLTTGETMQTNGDLKVTANKFTPNSSMITYIVTANYTEPETGQTLTAQGQITFSLMKLAPSTKSCTIVGESVFKYRSDGSHANSSSIALTATVEMVTLSKWQYKNASGVWTDYPVGIGEDLSATTLTVRDTDAVFVNDSVATIRALTSDPTIYDIHTITKLRDGAPGDKAISAVLTNENQRIPCNSEGTPVDHAFDNASCQIIIYNGGVNDTTNWTITSTPSTGVTIESRTATTQTNDTVKVGGMTTPTGNVTFTCTRDNYGSIIKTFSLVKVEAGQDGTSPTIYSVECSALAINKTTPADTQTASSYSPANVVVNSYQQTGNGAKTTYQGWFWIKAGSTDIYKSKNSNGQAEQSGSYTITSADMAKVSGNNNYITVELYTQGSFNTLVDSQTIVFTSDGAQGAQGNTGQAGADAINISVPNTYQGIPCNSDYKTTQAVSIDIPFTAYKGIEQVNCTVKGTPSTIAGVSPNTPIQQCTPTQTGHITYTIPQNTTISAQQGIVTLVFQCEGKEFTHNFTWVRNDAPKTAKLFELYSVTGNVFTSRESQNITIQGRLLDGSTDVTSSINSSGWVWAKYDVDQNNYVNITSTTEGYTIDTSGSSLTVNNSVVQGYASYRCTCTYANLPYVAYYSLIDRLDPIQASVFCSLGEQIVNGQGIGAFYVIVTDTGTGQELDPLKSDRFLTAAPSNPATNDYYYHLDSEHKTIVLKKYNGSAWVNAPTTDLPKGKYTWSFRDSSGHSTTFNSNAQITSGTGEPGIKAIYVDGTLVQKKIIVDAKVEI